MDFPGFYGNEQLKKNLSAALERQHAAHFYVISGPVGSGKKTLAKLLCAALLCRSQDHKPCCKCSQCHKVLSWNHPDLILVDDQEHKNISVSVIREARADLFIRPNEGAKKIYYIPRGKDLGIPSQNALLKVLEEPPPYGVFVVLTENPDTLLPTVRSRCTELKLQPLDASAMRQVLQERYPEQSLQSINAAIARSGGWLGQAQTLLESGESWFPQTKTFADVYGRKDRLGLLELMVSMERMKRDQLIPILNQWKELLAASLIFRSGLPPLDPLSESLASGRTAMELDRGVQDLTRAEQMLEGNVSPGAVCGALVWQLR